jgi:hypothetical protein
MIMEVAVALQNSTDDAGGEKKKEGDIIAIRPAGTGVGKKERFVFLWLRLEAEFDRWEFDLLCLPNYEPFEREDPVARFDKRRFSIPFARLQIVDPAFDINLARDPEYLYQPYLVTDEEDFTFVTTKPPFQVSGLVYDKAIGDYL